MTPKQYVLGAVALAVVGLAFVGAGSLLHLDRVGGSSYDMRNLVGDVYQGLNHTLMMQNGELVGPIDTTSDATFGGDVVITTAASATSTLEVGCVEAYATSSATKIRYVYTTSGTTTVSGAASGVVAWQYGSCP